jgi:DNA polymerase-3 subunit delta'
VLRLLSRLGDRPPQSLLLEGGDEGERVFVALHWACRVSCQSAGQRPCLACPICRQIKESSFPDLFRFDGRLKNKDDDEEALLVRPFSIENARALKSLLLEAPRGPGYRVVILEGIVQQREDAANALLKALEDPSPYTLFVLLAPQREQLLPTLASRSFCLTLPWPDSRAAPAAGARQAKRLATWEGILAAFLETGKGLSAAMAGKTVLDADMARQLILLCQKACVRAIAGEDAAGQRLAPMFASLDAGGKFLACRWFAQALEALRYNVVPTRVLRTTLTHVYLLLGDRGRAAAS